MVMNAQTHEFGVFIGGSNYIGDIGSTTYIAPNEPAFGILYKWNKSPRHVSGFYSIYIVFQMQVRLGQYMSLIQYLLYSYFRQ